MHAYVLGEHGDSEVLTWSNIDIGRVPFEDFIAFRNVEFNEEIKNKIDDGVRNAAYKIIAGLSTVAKDVKEIRDRFCLSKVYNLKITSSLLR